MAIPSTDWVAMGPIGMQPITAIATVAAHALGHRIKARDVTYGEVELVYLAGAASVAAGSLVAFDETSGTTALAVKGARRPLAVAVSACTAGYYGWFVTYGSAPVATLSDVHKLGAAYLSTTAGSVSGLPVEGERIDGLVLVSFPSGGFATARLTHPSANGSEENAAEERG